MRVHHRETYVGHILVQPARAAIFLNEPRPPSLLKRMCGRHANTVYKLICYTHMNISLNLSRQWTSICSNFHAQRDRIAHSHVWQEMMFLTQKPRPQVIQIARAWSLLVSDSYNPYTASARNINFALYETFHYSIAILFFFFSIGTNFSYVEQN